MIRRHVSMVVHGFYSLFWFLYFQSLIWIDPTILHFVLFYVEDGIGHALFDSP